jgi:hypothetical protein
MTLPPENGRYLATHPKSAGVKGRRCKLAISLGVHPAPIGAALPGNEGLFMILRKWRNWQTHQT